MIDFTNPYQTWRGQPRVKPTAHECHLSCLANAEEAAQNERATLALIDRLPVGDARIGAARLDLRRYRSEQPHWRDYAEYYRQLAAKEALTAPDVRLPREPGEDAEELPW